MQQNVAPAKKPRSRRHRVRRMFPDRRNEQRAGLDHRHGPGRRNRDKT